jgi:tartrate dehydratase beta subunit/fumarate hydratase class I family protein
MNVKTSLITVAAAAMLAGAGTAAMAQTQEDMSFGGMTKAARMDTDKDGMVSKAEFLAMMGKVWDMKAKEMKAKGDKLSMADFQQILMYMKAGS